MQHLAMIMDGNRRWAKEKKFEAVTSGHRRGVDTAKIAIKFCIKNSIKYLSLYTFSLENFSRSSSEKKYIFNLLVDVLKKNIDDFIKRGIRVRFIGDRNYFPNFVLPVIEEVEKKTKYLKTLQLNMLFCYGAKQELVMAAKKLASRVKDGLLEPADIDENSFRSEMWIGDIPDPDIIIRTGMISRLSNFLLFQAAYSELMFLDCYWPEVSEEILQKCVDKFHMTQRNFGA
jgi:undecaprenyl diphosphate synthase